MAPDARAVVVVKVNLRVPVVAARPGVWSVEALKAAACTLVIEPKVAATSVPGEDALSTTLPRSFKVVAVYVPEAFS